MNKLEANVSLFIITFFAAIQYIFLAEVPAEVSNFAFLSVTNFVGFIIVLILFISELFRIDKKHILQSLVLSVLLFVFNFFVLQGSGGIDSTVTAGVLSSYFVFIPPFALLLLKQKPKFNTILGSIVVLLGLFFMMNCNIKGLLNIKILFLIIADVAFAVYLVSAEKYASGANPSILALGQLFFNFIFATAGWIIEVLVTGGKFTLPTQPKFWGSVIFIAFFIRALYGVVQIYAQRYVSAINTSLIFSTEIIMTMLASPLLAKVFSLDAETGNITVFRIIGAVVMVGGILLADDTFFQKFFGKKKSAEGKSNE